jgi:hypothetical protein
MNPPDSIAPTARQFIESHVTSLDELEVLIAVVEAPSRWWDPGLVAHETGVSRHAAQAILERFAARNLLDIRITAEVRYQFRPGTEELEQGAIAVISAYHTAPRAVIRLVTERGRHSLRDFADAFRFRDHDRHR